MARMYAKVKGSTLNSRIRADGKFRSNANIGVDVDIDAITKKVYREVMKAIKSNEPRKINKMNETSVDSPAKEKGKQRRRWNISSSGRSMIAMQAVSSMVNITNSNASGDVAQIAQQNYTSAKGMGMLLLSTFGGQIGQLLAIGLNRLDGMVGQAVKNQIQLQYDNARLDYNMTRYDIGRYSTYTYDYEQNKWVARDTQRIRNNVLNQNTSV